MYLEEVTSSIKVGNRVLSYIDSGHDVYMSTKLSEFAPRKRSARIRDSRMTRKGQFPQVNQSWEQVFSCCQYALTGDLKLAVMFSPIGVGGMPKVAISLRIKYANPFFFIGTCI